MTKWTQKSICVNFLCVTVIFYSVSACVCVCMCVAIHSHEKVSSWRHWLTHPNSRLPGTHTFKAERSIWSLGSPPLLKTAFTLLVTDGLQFSLPLFISPPLSRSLDIRLWTTRRERKGRLFELKQTEKLKKERGHKLSGVHWNCTRRQTRRAGDEELKSRGEAEVINKHRAFWNV